MIRTIAQLVVSILLLWIGPAYAQHEDADRAREVVRRVYIEGFPQAEADALTHAGIDALIQMLTDREESRSFSNIVMALGMTGSHRAVTALLNFEQNYASGDVSKEIYSALSSLPIAMGYLARFDVRALDQLQSSLDNLLDDSEAVWRYRHLRGARLVGVLRRATMTGLAISGSPDAIAKLDQVHATIHSNHPNDAELAEHLQSARDLARRMSQGALRSELPSEAR